MHSKLVARLTTATALLLSIAGASAVPASASSANGELCSVQTPDGSVRAGAYTADDRTARSATRHQIDNAAGWCTDQIAVSGWTGANKTFDDYVGQRDVCVIQMPGNDIVVWIHADAIDPSAVNFASQMCRDVAGGNTNLIYWN